MKIIQKTGKFISLFVLSVMCIMVLSNTHLKAAEYECTVDIPVKVSVTGEDITTGIKYTVNIEAITENAPMPLETSLSITDSGSAKFSGIKYTTPGDYEYRIYQTIGSVDRLTYDTSFYTVTVRVTNLENSYGLEALIWAIKDDSDSKTDEVVFTNTFSAIPAEPEPEEPVEEDSGEPETTPADPDTTTSVQTGDTANIALYVIVMAAAAAVIIFLVIYSKRKKSE